MNLIYCGKNINMTYGGLYTIYKNTNTTYTLNDIGDKCFINCELFITQSQWRALVIKKILGDLNDDV